MFFALWAKTKKVAVLTEATLLYVMGKHSALSQLGYMLAQT